MVPEDVLRHPEETEALEVDVAVEDKPLVVVVVD